MKRATMVLAGLLPLVVGCETTGATLDPLGSPKKQPREPEVSYDSDYKVQTGVICRELSGQLNIRDSQGTARGIRCLQVGEGELSGCLKWGGEGAGYSYQSAGCSK